MQYLEKYINYWANYPDSVYKPIADWQSFQNKLQKTKAFQVNTALQDIYKKSAEVINDIDDSILSESLAAEKTKSMSALSDKTNILSTFLSTDADRMIAAWTHLPASALDAFSLLQNASDDELIETYLAVYTEDSGLSIGWWNSFALNGIGVLANEFKRVKEAEFIAQSGNFSSYPFCTDAPVDETITLGTVKSLAALLGVMGADVQTENTAPEKTALNASSAPETKNKIQTPKGELHPNMFIGSALPWAQKNYSFAKAVSDEQEPLTWTLFQPAIDIQSSLPANGKLLAANRYRYVEVLIGNKGESRYSTYMNQRLNIGTDSPDCDSITLNFFRTSDNKTPDATVVINNKWAIFNIYFQNNSVKGRDENNNEIIYIPVTVAVDGIEYVYFVEVSFNRKIPKAEDWTTLKTKPDFILRGAYVSGKSF
jgi:hypothetical protein